jgi:hypothetical protein
VFIVVGVYEVQKRNRRSLGLAVRLRRTTVILLVQQRGRHGDVILLPGLMIVMAWQGVAVGCLQLLQVPADRYTQRGTYDG